MLLLATSYCPNYDELYWDHKYLGKLIYGIYFYLKKEVAAISNMVQVANDKEMARLF